MALTTEAATRVAPRGRRSGTLAVALLACAVAAAPAFGAPFEVSSAHVGAHTTLQAEMEWSDAPGRHAWTLPKLKAEVPLIPHRLEFKLSNRYRFLRHYGAPSAEGWGDTELEIKWALASQGAHSPVDVAVEPKWYLPTGESRRGLGADGARLKVPVMVARRFGRARITAEFEYTRGFAAVPDGLDGGVLGLWQAWPELAVGAEIYVARDLVRNAATEVAANLGFKWQAATHWQFDALAGHSLRRAEQHAKLVAEYAF